MYTFEVRLSSPFSAGTNPLLYRENLLPGSVERRKAASWTVMPLSLDRPGSYCVLPRRPFFRQPGRARAFTERKRRFHAPARTPSGGCSRGQCQPNIPNSGSWHQDIATSMVRTDPFLGTHCARFIRQRTLQPFAFNVERSNSSICAQIVTSFIVCTLRDITNLSCTNIVVLLLYLFIPLSQILK